jgi:hypothetical protein
MKIGAGLSHFEPSIIKKGKDNQAPISEIPLAE